MSAQPRIIGVAQQQNEETATVICNLHGGMRSAAPTAAVLSLNTKALIRARDEAPLAVAANSARRRWQRALHLPI
jgi:hypothetical protein